MTEIYNASILALQVIIGVATGISLIHFAVVLLVRAGGGELPLKSPERPLRTIFMIPALNEELVIEGSVRRLLSLPGEATVTVIDDGSTDGTAAIVQRLAAESDRVRLIQRVAPNARQGKGEALNYAYGQIAASCRQEGIDPDTVIIAVMDADGLLDPHTLDSVSGLFGHDDVGAVQIGVRIINRQTLLGRLQDIEFFTYCRLYQQGRNHLGSTGLGGNGQFTRLSALLSLGDRPWTECLTEDLDLGLLMLLKGWRLAFTDQAYVHQQGLTNPRKLVRQRARWVQGYFQCWRRLPEIVVMRGRWYTVVDLIYSLVWPAMSCLVMPVAIVLSWIVVGWNITHAELSPLEWVSILGAGYVLAFGTSAILALNYRARSRDMSLGQTIMLVHGIGIFQVIWGLAGWRALWNILRGQGGWAKTERVSLAPATPDAA